jgi:heme-degrading monooxygenase HmoA
MIVILFRSRLTAGAGDDYARMAAEMDAHARTFPGFVDVKSFTAEDGERLTVVWWQDEATLGAWASDVRHLAAQRAGRERWYEYYRIEVAQIVRASQFERSQAAEV